jgi:EAL domain-containing protein (putative c-di-GMP-specific phosphodiesterase class I)
VELALDDFGTGYSSLSHLHRFPVDILKIDKSFIDRLGDGAGVGAGEGEGTIFARAIVSLGESLEIRTIAEGIERPEQLEALRALGCVYGQGYHFARPASGDAVGAMLREREADARAMRR